VETSCVELGSHTAQSRETSELLDDVVDGDGGGIHSGVSVLEAAKSMHSGAGRES
jgi:hypothetical protein